MAEKKGAAPKKAKGYQISKIYSGGKAKNKSCPKCGSGTFMAEHKERRTCGKCNYMEKK
jgi:ubiquitin-small subunit ribosomal protein S27Ae